MPDHRGEAIGPDLFSFYRSIGVNLKQLYGSTETAVFVCLQPDHEARARACYRDLVTAGLRRGWPPYRLGVDYMDLIGADEGSEQAELHQRLKAALSSLNPR